MALGDRDDYQPTQIRRRPLQHMELPVRVAPFWYRSLAVAVDVVPLMTIWALVVLGTGLMDTTDLPESRWNAFDMMVDLVNQRPLFFLPPILLWFGLLLLVYLVSELTMGQTVGKRLLNLTLVDQHGRRPEAIMILIRNLVRIVSLAAFGTGYLWAAFDTERRTFHDWVSGTWVVYRSEHVPC